MTRGSNIHGYLYINEYEYSYSSLHVQTLNAFCTSLVWSAHAVFRTHSQDFAAELVLLLCTAQMTERARLFQISSCQRGAHAILWRQGGRLKGLPGDGLVEPDVTPGKFRNQLPRRLW